MELNYHRCAVTTIEMYDAQSMKVSVQILILVQDEAETLGRLRKELPRCTFLCFPDESKLRLTTSLAVGIHHRPSPLHRRGHPHHGQPVLLPTEASKTDGIYLVRAPFSLTCLELDWTAISAWSRSLIR